MKTALNIIRAINFLKIADVNDAIIYDDIHVFQKQENGMFSYKEILDNHNDETIYYYTYKKVVKMFLKLDGRKSIIICDDSIDTKNIVNIKCDQCEMYDYDFDDFC